jgi:flagellar biosynthesis/type III secretory pathway chaperone
MSTENQLLQLLEKMITLQKSLYQLSLKKADMLKNDDIDALSQLIKNELSHIKAMEAFDQKREDLQRNLAFDLGISSQNLTISDFLNQERVQKKERLKELQLELMGTTEYLKKQNEFNQELLTQSLNFVNLNLDLFTGQQDSGNYSRDDVDEDQTSTLSIFNRKA